MQKNLNDTYKGFRSRANLTWHVDSDAMVYYTCRNGFPSRRIQSRTSGDAQPHHSMDLLASSCVRP